jgi:hypothetical protein
LCVCWSKLPGLNRLFLACLSLFVAGFDSPELIFGLLDLGMHRGPGKFSRLVDAVDCGLPWDGCRLSGVEVAFHWVSDSSRRRNRRHSRAISMEFRRYLQLVLPVWSILACILCWYFSLLCIVGC